MARTRSADTKESRPGRLDEVLRQSENKQRISLQGMGLTEFPKTLRHATELVDLDISGNRFTELPNWLGELPKLEFIDARQTPLQHFGTGRALIQLDLEALAALPKESPFDRLIFICDAHKPPDAILNLLRDRGRLAQVHRLALHGFGRPTEGDKPLGVPAVLQEVLNSLHHFDGLRSLQIVALALGELPNAIAGLQHLGSLSATALGLKSLPRWLTQLPLKTLELEFNIFSTLPEWLPELTSLTKLDLFHNERLKRLPPQLFDLPALRDLNLFGCPVREIPKEVLRLKSLVNLNFDLEELQSPPPEVAVSGLDAIRNYWRQQEQAGIDYLCEAKLIILGEGGAGKSTLARKIQNPACVVDPHEMSTEGIDIVRYQFPTTLRTAAVQGTPSQALQRDFQVNIWDFGGQEIYHATHQFFLTRRSVYLLVCDDRKEDTDFSYWLQAVEALSDGSPLLIVQNEKQDRSRDIGLADLRARFANLRGAWATNLASNRGLDAVLAAVRRELESLPHVGTALPATWKRVRQALEEDPRDTIGLDAYLKLCDEHGFARREDKLMLSQYLHDLGICLHFQDDAVLKHTIVLKPTWGTDAVYRVLDDPAVKAAHGQFHKGDLARIWCETKYLGMQDELLRLMARFQLCYALGEQDTPWMAPQLLPADRPTFDWPRSSPLTVSWRYDFMPKGLLTRFIVNQHDLIADGAPLWKSGVMLQRNGTRALVVEDYPRRRITVQVVGADARGLLAIVDDQVQRLNKAFPRLKVERWLPCPCAECRNKPEPEAFALEKLTKMATRGQDIQCHESGEMVSATELLQDLLPAVLQHAKVFNTDLYFNEGRRSVVSQAGALPELDLVLAAGPNPPPPRPRPQVYVSYASGPESNALVEQLDSTLKSAGIQLLRDRKEIGYKDSVGDFMQRIAQGRCVVAVISKKYLESEYCMTELVGMLKANDLRDRIFPIVLEDAQLYRPVACVRYAAHWEAESEELNNELKRVRGDNLARLQAKLTDYTEFRRLFDDVSDTLRDMNALTPAEHSATGFAALRDQVSRRLGVAEAG